MQIPWSQSSLLTEFILLFGFYFSIFPKVDLLIIQVSYSLFPSNFSPYMFLEHSLVRPHWPAYLLTSRSNQHMLISLKDRVKPISLSNLKLVLLSILYYSPLYNQVFNCMLFHIITFSLFYSCPPHFTQIINWKWLLCFPLKSLDLRYLLNRYLICWSRKSTKNAIPSKYALNSLLLMNRRHTFFTYVSFSPSPHQSSHEKGVNEQRNV